MEDTIIQFEDILRGCRSLFINKMKDYGAAWRVLRPTSVTDQIYIKVNRIRTIQIGGVAKVNESQESEFIAIVNYSLIGLIQLKIGFHSSITESPDEVLTLYERFLKDALDLMEKKNHDYGEAWRDMRISSITDLIYQKVLRTKQIEDNEGKTITSEGIEANYLDMLNYAVFALIKLKYKS